LVGDRYNGRKISAFLLMASRSLTASESGIAAIQNKLTAKKWSHEALAAAAEISRATAIGFCTGKPVDRKNFVTCCEVLDLDWEVVFEQKELLSQPVAPATDIDALVQQLCETSAESLRKRCGTMRILDMTQPIDSGAIYTDVNILERVAGKTRAEITQLMADCGAEGFDRFFLGNVKQERVEGLKAVLENQQLMILGRPGAGKTTFLKRLAIVCLKGEFLRDRLPIFVTLKEFAEAEAEPGIIDFMAGVIVGAKHSAENITTSSTNQLPNASPLQSTRLSLSEILRSGRGLVLLDGLDEVMEKDHDRIIRAIREFSQTYDKNHIVITCRIAAREYIFQQFTEVEMADFDDKQIQSFADKWFKTKERNPESSTGKIFWRELESRDPVKELATNPLLLTLLCLEFDNAAAFPQSRSELYERALNVLMTKWDGQRRIKRDEVYKSLSLKRKETLLGQLAMYTFERGDYFFRERVAMGQIEQYIRNLPRIRKDSEDLLVDSWVVLKSIESQHGLLAERATGIYSFSHLTFHEYFTARNILDSSNPAAQEAALQKLIEHLEENRWKEVFLLVVEGLDNSDYLLKLMQQKIDLMMAGDPKLQSFLEWVHEKSVVADAKYISPVTIRAFYLAIGSGLDNLTEARRVSNISHTEIARGVLRSAYELSQNLKRFFFSDPYLDFAKNLSYDLALDLALTNNEDSDLEYQIQVIEDQLPLQHNLDPYKWWKKNGGRWTENLRKMAIKHRNIGHNWGFTDEQIEKITKYYTGNLFLMECLNSECYISREVCEEIEATMLLPLDAIKKYESEHFFI
jgi:predicted NACHT family NTPase